MMIILKIKHKLTTGFKKEIIACVAEIYRNRRFSDFIYIIQITTIKLEFCTCVAAINDMVDILLKWML